MAANTRAVAVSHVMTVLDFNQEIREYLKEQGYATIGQLLSIAAQDIEDLKTESEGLFKLRHAKSIKLFKEWILNYMESNDDNLPQDWKIGRAHV